MKAVLGSLFLAALAAGIGNADEQSGNADVKIGRVFEEDGRTLLRIGDGEPEPYLGIRLELVDKATAAQLDEVPEGFGLLVVKVEPESPAAAAKLQALDVLWKFEDQLLANPGQLYSLMKMKGVDATVDFAVCRKGKTQTVPVTLAPRVVEGLPANVQMMIGEGASAEDDEGEQTENAIFNSRAGFIEDGDETMQLVAVDGGYEYVVSFKGEKIETGVVESSDPATWPKHLSESNRRKLSVLFSIFRSEERWRNNPARKPRVRRVPTPTE